MNRKQVARLLSSLRRWSWPHPRSFSGRAFLPHVERSRRIVLRLESLEEIAAASSLLPVLAPLGAASLAGTAEPPSQTPAVERPSDIADSSMPLPTEEDRGLSDLGFSHLAEQAPSSMDYGPFMAGMDAFASNDETAGRPAAHDPALDPVMATDNALVDPLSHPDSAPANGAQAGPHHAGPSAGNGLNGNAANLAGAYAGAGQGPGGASTPFTASGGSSGGGGGSPVGGNLAALANEGAFAAPQFAAVAANNAASTTQTLPPTTATTPTPATPATATIPTPQATTNPVHATFNLSALEAADFPSDYFTVAEPNNLTGLRVHLPLPDPTNPSDPVNNDTNVLNTLDGFNLQPRLSIPFDGPIDPTSVNSKDVFLINLGDTVDHQEHGDHIVGINQVVWDPVTNTLHAESDQLLDQHTRYALIVTNGVLADGQPVQASEDFTRFRHDLNFGQTKDPGLKEYRKDLLDATAAARQVGVPESDIVTASVFTTESATAVLEKIRNQIDVVTPAPANFNLGSNGEPTVFSLDEVKSITFNEQTHVAGPNEFQSVPVDLSLLGKDPAILPSAVGKVEFGSYSSPDYEVHPDAAGRLAGEPGEYIPSVDTGTGTPVVQRTNTIYFNLFLPSGEEPQNGWPVAIHGIGANGSKQRDLYLVDTMAQHGIATLIINSVGRGYGPDGTLVVDQTDGSSVTLPAGGRGIDQTGRGGTVAIGVNEGQNATGSKQIIGNRDAIQQTVVDYMQLVRVIQGHGIPDLNPSSISYFGWSLGTTFGTLFLAVEPSVQAGALYSVGGPVVENNRLSPVNRSALGASLASQVPSLINFPGINSLEGVPLSSGPFFNENMPLRVTVNPDGTPNYHPLTVDLTDGTTDYTIQSPVTNTVAGAMAIQAYLTKRDWVNQSGNQVAYAPHLRKDPLLDDNGDPFPAKSVLILFGKGDKQVPNPNATAMLRAGDLADRAIFYRNDLAYVVPYAVVPTDPHAFVNNILGPDPSLPSDPSGLVAAIARGAQNQIAAFLASNGTADIQLPVVPLEFPQNLFETLTRGTLPEDLNFIP